MITLLLTAALAFDGAERPTCGLPMAHALDLARPTELTPLDLRRGLTDGKLERDSFTDFPNQLAGDNFVIKWGVNDSGIRDGSPQELLDALEASWDVYIDTWDYTVPASGDTHLINVYIGDTGSGAPDSLGAGGYYWYDDDGYPMLVVAMGSLDDPQYTLTVAAHEFFHAIQDANGGFAYDDDSGWWWEATAMWVEHEVFPDNDSWPVFLYWFAIRPELAVSHFKYPTTGTPEEYHQYGAFVYITHITDRWGTELVQHSFERSFDGDLPLEVVAELIAEAGGDVEADFADFALRNGNWDYPTEDWFETWIDAYGGYDSGRSHRIAGTVVGETSGQVSPAENLPRTYGANYWELLDMGSRVELSFASDEDVTWHVGVATQTGTTHDSHPIELTDGEGSVVIDGLDAVDEAWLVVAATGSLRDDGTTYDYQVQVTEISEAGTDPDDEEKRACGCDSTPAPLAWTLVLPLALVLRRRR